MYKITPILVGRCESPEPRLLYLGDPSGTIPTIFTFFLLQGKDRVVLVDVGFTAEICEQFMPDVVQAAGEDPLVQLQALGVAPQDVNEIILTHAHFDHLSSVIHEYKNARIHMQRAEYEIVANPPHPWCRELIDLPTLEQLAEEGPPRFNLIDGESELVEGIWTVPTPGHTAGHQSVLVQTPNGKTCIVGDALLNYRTLSEDVGPGFNCNLIEAMQSIQTLRKLQNEGVKILCGHDPAVLERSPS